jgi:hypothetical protein
MTHDSKYSISKSVLYPVCVGVFFIAAGIILLSVRPEENFGLVLGVALIWVALGLTGIISNISRCCWYPVILDKHIVLEHRVFPSRTRVIGYEDILYARVAEFRVRQYDRAPVLTVVMKNGKEMSFILMIGLEHIVQLRQELLDKGLSDTYEMPASVTGRKVYRSKGALAIFIGMIAVTVAGYCLGVMKLADPLIIVVTIIFIPFLLFLLNLLSYIVVEDRRIMLKYMVFRSRNLEIILDDAYDISIGGGSHFDVLLRTPDKSGKSRHTRIVGLITIDMIQEINSWLKSQGTNLSESE